MATAILHSFKQGAYIAIALYVAFIVAITVSSMKAPSIDPVTASVGAPVLEVERPAANVQERAS